MPVSGKSEIVNREVKNYSIVPIFLFYATSNFHSLICFNILLVAIYVYILCMTALAITQNDVKMIQKVSDVLFTHLNRCLDEMTQCR